MTPTNYLRWCNRYRFTDESETEMEQECVLQQFWKADVAGDLAPHKHRNLSGEWRDVPTEWD